MSSWVLRLLLSYVWIHVLAIITVILSVAMIVEAILLIHKVAVVRIGIAKLSREVAIISICGLIRSRLISKVIFLCVFKFLELVFQCVNAFIDSSFLIFISYDRLFVF